METFSVLLALCAGNSPITAEFPSQRPVKWSFDVFFDLSLKKKRLSKQSCGWWFEIPSCSLWHHCNEWGISGMVLPCLICAKYCFVAIFWVPNGLLWSVWIYCSVFPYITEVPISKHSMLRVNTCDCHCAKPLHKPGISYWNSNPCQRTALNLDLKVLVLLGKPIWKCLNLQIM